MKKMIVFILLVFLFIPGVMAQFPPVRRVEILYPKNTINLTQGETSQIPVNVNNTGNVTLANLNVSFEVPEGWRSSWALIKILFEEINKTVTLNLTPSNSSFGMYNITIRVVSPLGGLNTSKVIRANVSGEKPPELVEEERKQALKEEADEMISKARESIQKALDMGLNVTGAANVFSRAIEKYNEGNYTEAILLASLSYNASEQLIAEGEPSEKERESFDYGLILILMVFIIILIGVNKYLL